MRNVTTTADGAPMVEACSSYRTSDSSRIYAFDGGGLSTLLPFRLNSGATSACARRSYRSQCPWRHIISCTGGKTKVIPPTRTKGKAPSNFAVLRERLKHDVPSGTRAVSDSLVPTGCARPVPIVCQDARLGQLAASFAGCFSAPQRRHVVTVLLALLLGRATRPLAGLPRQVAGGRSVASLSRFRSEAPWSAPAVAATWQCRFATPVAPLVAVSHQRQRQGRPPRWGRPSPGEWPLLRGLKKE